MHTRGIAAFAALTLLPLLAVMAPSAQALPSSGSLYISIPN